MQLWDLTSQSKAWPFPWQEGGWACLAIDWEGIPARPDPSWGRQHWAQPRQGRWAQPCESRRALAPHCAWGLIPGAPVPEPSQGLGACELSV